MRFSSYESFGRKIRPFRRSPSKDLAHLFDKLLLLDPDDFHQLPSNASIRSCRLRRCLPVRLGQYPLLVQTPVLRLAEVGRRVDVAAFYVFRRLRFE